MTDFKRGHFTKTKRGNTSWQGILIIFFILIFSFALIKGLSGNNSSDKPSAVSWDGLSPFGLFVNAKEDFLVVFQREPKRIALLKLGNYFQDGETPEDVMKKISSDSGVIIKNYAQDYNFDEKLEDYLSFTSPVKILLGNGDVSTNVSRYDALRLWWQAKSIRSNEVIRDDISGLNESSSNVLGVNNRSLNRALKPYFENYYLIEERTEVSVINSSGNQNAGLLITSFIESMGGRIVETNEGDFEIDKCSIQGAKSYARDYLAKTFDCDINDGNLEELVGSKLIITVGQDFASKYF